MLVHLTVYMISYYLIFSKDVSTLTSCMYTVRFTTLSISFKIEKILFLRSLGTTVVLVPFSLKTLDIIKPVCTALNCAFADQVL
jgi:hypothetical protein